METLISIIAVLMLALNLPMATALMWGIRLTTTSTCPEDIKSAKHNRMMLKFVALADVAFAVILFIASLC